jgi:vacuolar iron transporter family protein
VGDGAGDQVTAEAPQQAAKRLIEAWRGEIEAEVVYRSLADRQTDERRAKVLHKMAGQEAQHRLKLEKRMQELGIPLPDPSSVKISRLKRLQLRLAPDERVLAMQEAAEHSEIDDSYLRPTGDQQTDKLFSEIREDEESHARRITILNEGRPAKDTGPAGRLEQIIGRERWHQTGSGWISGAIYGANDGLAAVFGIVAGVSGATGGSNFVLTAGLAGAISSALSMATGAYLAERSVAEVSAANLEQERREIEENLDEEREEVSLYYQLKGIPEEQADELAEKLSTNPQALLQVMAAEELGGAQTGSKPGQAALAAGISTAVGAMVPVLPYFWLRGTSAIIWAAIISLVAHFAVGAAKSLVTLRTWWAAGLEMTMAGIIVGAVTYVAGLLFGGA